VASDGLRTLSAKLYECLGPPEALNGPRAAGVTDASHRQSSPHSRPVLFAGAFVGARDCASRERLSSGLELLVEVDVDSVLARSAFFRVLRPQGQTRQERRGKSERGRPPHSLRSPRPRSDASRARCAGSGVPPGPTTPEDFHRDRAVKRFGPAARVNSRRRPETGSASPSRVGSLGPRSVVDPVVMAGAHPRQVGRARAGRLSTGLSEAMRRVYEPPHARSESRLGLLLRSPACVRG
jgi:hypothetical protein